MASAIDAFKSEAKKNLHFAYGGFGGLGLLFAASDVKGIMDSDNKFKALLKTMKDFVLIRASMIGVFSGITSAIRAMAKDTGSLDAALARMAATQHFTRVFTPFAGGAKAARQHVADLLLLSARTPFKFEGMAEADRSLQGLTRGAFAGTGALTMIGDAAAKSGNGIEESARAVGEFYATLRNGEPIARSVDQIRQMGLISTTAADNLTRLADSGATATEMTNNLTTALMQSKGGMADFSKDLEAMTAASEKAAEGAKAAFGKEFVKPDISSTRNYTAALVAITPALETAGRGLAALSNGFGQWKSVVVKTVAESSVFQAFLKSLPVLLAAVGAAAFAYGIPALIGLTAAAFALNPVLGILVGVLGGGAALLTGGGLVKGILQLKKSMSEGNLFREMVRGHREAQAALDAHAASIETLAELHEQYGRTIERIITLQNELNEAEAKGNKKQIAEIIRAMLEARQKMAMLAPMANVLASPERMAVIQQRIGRMFEEERARFEEGIRAHPGEAPERRRGRAALLEERAARGEAGLMARQRFAAEEQGPIGAARAQATADLEEARTLSAKGAKEIIQRGIKSTPEQAMQRANLAIAAADAQLNKLARDQGRGTALALEHQAQQLEAAQQVRVLESQLSGAADNRTRKEIQREIAVARVRAGGAVAGAGTGQQIQDLRAQAGILAKEEADANMNAMEAREQRAAAIEEERSRKITELEVMANQGQIRARLMGSYEESKRLENAGRFLSKFEQYRQQFDEQTAKRMAITDTQLEVMGKQAQDLIQAQKPIADSLARVGGGGGVGGPTGDPMLTIQQRVLGVEQDANRILAQIEQNTAQSGTPEPGGGAPEERPIAPEVQPLEGQVPPELAPYTKIPTEEEEAKTTEALNPPGAPKTKGPFTLLNGETLGEWIKGEWEADVKGFKNDVKAAGKALKWLTSLFGGGGGGGTEEGGGGAAPAPAGGEAEPEVPPSKEIPGAPGAPAAPEEGTPPTASVGDEIRKAIEEYPKAAGTTTAEQVEAATAPQPKLGLGKQIMLGLTHPFGIGLGPAEEEARRQKAEAERIEREKARVRPKPKPPPPPPLGEEAGGFVPTQTAGGAPVPVAVPAGGAAYTRTITGGGRFSGSQAAVQQVKRYSRKEQELAAAYGIDLTQAVPESIDWGKIQEMESNRLAFNKQFGAAAAVPIGTATALMGPTPGMEGVEQRPGESKKEAWSRHMDEWKVGQQLKGNEWAIHMAGWKGEQAQAIEQHGKDMEAWQADQVAKKEDWEQHMSDWRKDQGIPEPKVSLPKAIGETGIEAISGGRLAEATAPTGQGQQQDQTVALLSKIANNSDTSNEHLSSISADSADAQKAM